MKEKTEKRWVWERGHANTLLSQETALVTALTYLRLQARTQLRLTYISRLYLPIYLVHIKAKDSLIIGGIGQSSVTLKNVTVLPPEALEDLFGQVEDVQQVPRLIENLEKLVKNLYPTSIILPNVMEPSMIEPLRRLIEPSLSVPSEKECIESTLPMNDIIELGLGLQDEIKRLESCRGHLIRIAQALNKYIEVQLQYINEQRLKIHQDTAAELGMARVLERLEEILRFATQQCRQFLLQMDATPTKTELLFSKNPIYSIQPQTMAHDFRQSLHQTSIELDVAFTQLEEAERQWQSIFEQEQIGLDDSSAMANPLEKHVPPSPRSVDSFGTDSQLITLVSLREQILRCYPNLRQTLQDMSTKLEQQNERFMKITVKADDLQGDHSLVRVLVPVFVTKTKDPARHGIIPPLKFLRPASPHHYKRSRSVPPAKAFNITLFDDPFCNQLDKWLRTEILTRPTFLSCLDQQALQNNWLDHPKRIDKFLQGIQQLSLSGLISKYLIDDLTNFWLRIK
jgi:hypothetical protein